MTYTSKTLDMLLRDDFGITVFVAPAGQEGLSVLQRKKQKTHGTGARGTRMEMKKELDKPSLLFIFTGLGKYSWYKLPFIKRTIFCAGLPQVLVGHIQRLLRYKYGKCKCNIATCEWVSILGVTIGACKESNQRMFGKKDARGKHEEEICSEQQLL
jgi:hypothetical protein